MKFILKDGEDYKLIIEHDGKKTEWDIAGFKRTPVAKSQEEFDYINQYCAYLSHRRQTDIFEKLVDVHNVFQGFGDFNLKQQKLTKAVTNLFGIIDEEHIMDWVKNVSNIPIATNLKEKYSEHDKDPHKTYLRNEYYGLVMLMITLRFMTGIWGQYLYHNHKKVGTDFKEYTALRLLDKTWVASCEPTVRLRQYVEAWIKQNNKSEAAVMGGVSSYELPVFVLATIMVRKLTTGSMDAELDNGGIVVNIYRGLMTVLNDLAGKFSALADKTAHIKDSRNEDQSNWSTCELYKIMQPMSAGQIITISYFVDQTYSLANQIDPTLPKAILDQCIDNISKLPNYTVEQHSALLAQWTLSPAVRCRIFYHESKDKVLNLVALAQALLWHWDFPDLALLITTQADKTRLVTGAQAHRVKKRVRNDPMAELDSRYPYHKPNKIKPRDNNPAHQAISMFKEDLRSCWLQHNPPLFMKEYAEEVEIDDRGSLAPDDLSTQLAELLVHTGKVAKLKKSSLNSIK